MQLHIEVTEEDIKNGVRHISTRCPIACALRRMGHKDITVGPNRVYVGDRFSLHTPESKQFVNDFDAECPVQPFAFDVELKKPNYEVE